MHITGLKKYAYALTQQFVLKKEKSLGTQI